MMIRAVRKVQRWQHNILIGEVTSNRPFYLYSTSVQKRSVEKCNFSNQCVPQAERVGNRTQGRVFVCYDSIKRELKRRLIYECPCVERLKSKTERSTRLGYTGLLGELEHLKIKTRLIDERFASVMGECVTLKWSLMGVPSRLRLMSKGSSLSRVLSTWTKLLFIMNRESES